MKKLIVITGFIACIFTLLAAGVISGYAQENYPQRIVSLGPSITKGLYLLGVEDNLIANTIHCNNPPSARNKEKIGTAVEVNIEKVFNLKPDLVLATSLTSSKAKEKLSNLGLRVVTFSTAKDFSGLCRQFLELGKLVGRKNESEEIVKNARDKAAFVKEKVKNLSKPKVFIQIGARPLTAATGGYFVNDYIEFAGAVNIAKEEKKGIYSKERVLMANPDVIIITTMGMAGEEEKKNWENFHTLSAVKSKRIYIINTEKLTSPTPASFVETLEELVVVLHPRD